jgi:hypothetical protein
VIPDVQHSGEVPGVPCSGEDVYKSFQSKANVVQEIEIEIDPDVVQEIEIDPGEWGPISIVIVISDSCEIFEATGQSPAHQIC